ncbi:MAG: hypothetical protein WC829_09865 [Hyphomicrobium sp.]|jgi:hypothetical protein
MIPAFLQHRGLAATVRSLFGNGEVGAWYDPSDLATLFQNSAGTTPVTAVEQPVGLILDKSKGLVLGAELVAPLDFATGWTASGSAVTVNSATSFTTTAVANYYKPYFTVGKWYKLTATITFTTPSLTLFNATTAVNPISTSLTSGVAYTCYFLAGATQLNFRSGGAGTVTVDNISAKELPGQHSRQATSAERPVLKATPTRIDYDAVDDTLVATFASSLGTDCTVCRAVPGVGASILTGQTIGTTYTDSTDHAGLIIVNRALTAGETASVTTYLNLKAGV